MSIFQPGTVLVTAALLAACGDGSVDTAPPTGASGQVPASATASVRAYTEFAGSLSFTEVLEPLTMDDTVPPTSESDEPLPVS